MSDRSDSRAIDREFIARGKKIAWLISGLVLLLVLAMRSPYKIPLPDPDALAWLPAVHAVLNSLVAVCLVLALLAVKRGRIPLHQRFMTAALVLSGLFLLGYVAYHFTTVETLFGDADGDGVVDEAEKAEVGGTRALYLALLISHIVLAAVSFPLILRAFVYAWGSDFAAHRRLVKWVYPLWLYVALTGPACYLMLRPYYD